MTIKFSELTLSPDARAAFLDAWHSAADPMPRTVFRVVERLQQLAGQLAYRITQHPTRADRHAVISLRECIWAITDRAIRHSGLTAMMLPPGHPRRGALSTEAQKLLELTERNAVVLDGSATVRSVCRLLRDCATWTRGFREEQYDSPNAFALERNILTAQECTDAVEAAALEDAGDFEFDLMTLGGPPTSTAAP